MSDSAKGPSELFTFIEVHPVSLCRPFFGHHMKQSFYHVPAGYHNGKAALGYIDGGARVRKWMDVKTTDLLATTTGESLGQSQPREFSEQGRHLAAGSGHCSKGSAPLVSFLQVAKLPQQFHRAA